MLVAADNGSPDDVRALLEEVLTAVNAQLPDYARVEHFIVATDPFTAANGELSSSGSLRRRVIEAHYAACIQQSEKQHEHIF